MIKTKYLFYYSIVESSEFVANEQFAYSAEIRHNVG